MSVAPAISVLVPSYNYEGYLDEALRSVLNQTWGDFELVVVDDGSHDGSLALARAFAAQDSRVRVFTHPDGHNHGLPATLALGIAHARGRHIAFLESDDLWERHCLARRMAALEEAAPLPSTGVVFNNITPLVMPGAHTAWFDGYVRRVMREHAAPPIGTAAPHALRTGFLTENKIPTFSCAMVRTDLLRTCSLTPPVPRWLDWWIWTQLVQRTHFIFISEELTRWRLHPDSQNSAISFTTYVRDYRRMWGGFRRLLGEDAHPDVARVLRRPFWTRILARFCLLARAEGVKGALGRINSRLGGEGGVFKR